MEKEMEKRKAFAVFLYDAKIKIELIKGEGFLHSNFATGGFVVDREILKEYKIIHENAESDLVIQEHYAICPLGYENNVKEICVEILNEKLLNIYLDVSIENESRKMEFTYSGSYSIEWLLE